MSFQRVSQCVCAAKCKHHKGRCEEMVAGLYCRCCAKARKVFRAVPEQEQEVVVL